MRKRFSPGICALLLVALVALALAGCAPRLALAPAAEITVGESPTLPAPETETPRSEITYILDDSILDDPQEGEVSIFEAQRLLHRFLSEHEDPFLLSDTGIAFVYRGMAQYRGRTYYQIYLGEMLSEGFRELTMYLVGVEGDIYVQSEETGEYLQLKSPVCEVAPEWQGTYLDDGDGKRRLTIGECTENSLAFSFDGGQEGEELYGVAPFKEGNVYQAQYMDLRFTLNDDSTIVLVEQIGEEEDRAARKYFAGMYVRLDQHP